VTWVITTALLHPINPAWKGVTLCYTTASPALQVRRLWLGTVRLKGQFQTVWICKCRQHFDRETSRWTTRELEHAVSDKILGHWSGLADPRSGIIADCMSFVVRMCGSLLASKGLLAKTGPDACSSGTSTARLLDWTLRQVLVLRCCTHVERTHTARSASVAVLHTRGAHTNCDWTACPTSIAHWS
jgi:hypothetical protein